MAVVKTSIKKARSRSSNDVKEEKKETAFEIDEDDSWGCWNVAESEETALFGYPDQHFGNKKDGGKYHKTWSDDTKDNDEKDCKYHKTWSDDTKDNDEKDCKYHKTWYDDWWATKDNDEKDCKYHKTWYDGWWATKDNDEKDCEYHKTWYDDWWATKDNDEKDCEYHKTWYDDWWATKEPQATSHEKDGDYKAWDWMATNEAQEAMSDEKDDYYKAWNDWVATEKSQSDDGDYNMAWNDWMMAIDDKWADDDFDSYKFLYDWFVTHGWSESDDGWCFNENENENDHDWWGLDDIDWTDVKQFLTYITDHIPDPEPVIYPKFPHHKRPVVVKPPNPILQDERFFRKCKSFRIDPLETARHMMSAAVSKSKARPKPKPSSSADAWDATVLLLIHGDWFSIGWFSIPCNYFICNKSPWNYEMLQIGLKYNGTVSADWSPIITSLFFRLASSYTITILKPCKQLGDEKEGGTSWVGVVHCTRDPA